MRELTSVGEALEYVRAQETDYFRELRGRDSPAYLASREIKGDLLFFPRKKLRMQKLRSGNWEPRAWFIQDRLEERVTALNQPTDISHEGITSGLRSAIVKEPNGTYLRLKGVAPKTYETQRKFIGPATKNVTADKRGLVTFGEAYSEHAWMSELNQIRFPFVCMKPAFIEFFLPPPKANEAQEFIRQYVSNDTLPVHLDIGSLKTTKVRFDVLEKFRRITQAGYYGFNPNFVSAFEITGDTRLDETLYELTRTELSGERKSQRDDLVQGLSFNAGTILAFLNNHGFAWSAKLNATNSHLGNFVLGQRNGKLQMNICDLDAMDFDSSFDGGIASTGNKFWDHIGSDMDLFRNDFFADYTTSHPVSLKYKHFPEELRETAFQAFKTGYAVIVDHLFRRCRTIMPNVVTPDRIIVPERSVISAREFRERVDYVSGKK